MTKRDKMYQEIEKHGNNLNAIFNTGIDTVKLSKKLFSLENKAHRLSTQYCNGDIDMDAWDVETNKILASIAKVLDPDNADVEILVNGDCRGYALKIRFDDTDARNQNIYTDWGGYGILAPDFS